jgi:hypothetical protein
MIAASKQLYGMSTTTTTTTTTTTKNQSWVTGYT